MIDVLIKLDAFILLFVQEHMRFGALDAVMSVITALGNAGAVWLTLSAVLLAIRKTRWAGVTLLTALALGALVNNVILKNIIGRPRPFEAVAGLRILINRPAGYSFPSGHTSASFAAACALTRSFGRRGAWVYFPAGLIALSRVYVGVHYPGDVLAGAAVGTLMALAACRLTEAVRRRRVL